MYNKRSKLSARNMSSCLAFTAFAFGCTTLSAAVIEEIIITAQKREQNLSDVGISVTAFSGDQIKELGLTSTQQIDQHTPGLMVTDYGGGVTTVFTIRGSSQLDFSDQQEPPVAVYVDETYNSYLAGVGFNFYDLDRIEILRGPQGTLFGRNATGGLAHLISRRPSQEYEGYVDLSVAEYGKVRVEAAAGGPLTDTLSGRLSLMSDKDDGYVKNREGGGLLKVNNNSGRAQLLFEPSEDLSLLLSARWSIDDGNGQGWHIQRAVTDFGGAAGLTGDGLVKLATSEQHQVFCGQLGYPVPALGSTDCLGFKEPADGVHKVGVDQSGDFEREHYGTTAKLEWKIGEVILSSITNYQDFSKDYLEDTDGTAAPLFEFFQNMDSNQFSQELRLAGENETLNWVTGIYYLNIDGTFNAGSNLSGLFGFDNENNYELETTSYAVFGQAEYDISKTLTALTGFRWTEDKKDYLFNVSCTEQASGTCDAWFAGTVQQTGFNGKRSEGEWSGMLELDWRPNNDWLVYGKLSRGNKAGGFNGSSIAFFAPEETEFDSEILTSYELGFKGELMDGGARVNASVFVYDYKDFQTFTTLGASYLLFNIDAKMTGAEVEFIVNPADGLEFLFGVSVMDSEQIDLVYPDGVSRNPPTPNTPELSINGLARYEWSALGGQVAAQIDFNYVDERSLNAVPHPALFADSYFVANAKLGWTSANEHWGVDLWVKNLGDEDYQTTVFDASTFTGVTLEAYGSPRWAGVNINYQW